MGDDETIVIRVNAAQGEAALKALGTAGIQAGKDIGSIEGATEGSTDKLAAFGAKLFGLTKIAGTFGEVIRQVGNNVHFESDAAKEATTATADLFSAIGSLDAQGVGAALGRLIGNLEVMREGIENTTLALGAMADASKAEKFAGILKVQADLVAGHKAEVAALDQKATALSREITVQQAAGEVQKFVRDEIQATLDAYDRAGAQVPAKLAEQAAALGIVSKAQQETAASASELEAVGVKAAEERAKAEQKAADEIVADLARQEEAFNKLLADTAAYVAERDKILNAPNKGFDGSPDKSGAAQSLAGLKEQIKEIQDSPLVSPEQANQLQDLRRQAADAARAVSDLGQSYTLANMNGEELAIKQNAAWEKYYALRHANDAIVQRNVDADLRALADQTDAVGELTDSTEGAAGAFSDAADAAGSLGDKAKEGTEKGKEGLDKMNDGLKEAIPLAEQLRGILQEIVTLGSQADI